MSPKSWSHRVSVRSKVQQWEYYKCNDMISDSHIIILSFIPRRVEFFVCTSSVTVYKFASSMMFTIIILIILICIGIKYLVPIYRKQLPLIQAGNALPGPKTLPLIGNANHFLLRNSDGNIIVIFVVLFLRCFQFKIFCCNNIEKEKEKEKLSFLKDMHITY